MSILLNFSIIVFLLLLVGILLYFKLTEHKSSVLHRDSDASRYSINAMIEYVKEVLNDFLNSNLAQMGLAEEEFRRRKNKRMELKRALKGCVYGDQNDKTYVKEFIFDLLYKTYGLTETTIDLVLPFEEPYRLSAQDKFEILLHLFKRGHGNQALSALIDKYELDRVKRHIEGGTADSYLITREEIEEIYRKEIRPLSFEDKLHILVQRIYQNYKGFGVIDEIRDMNIDGVSGGVSGIPTHPSEYEFESMEPSPELKAVPNSYDSVWIFYKGKSIHLSFLSFGSEQELKRVCLNIYKYNNPGQLSETNGYKVNEMKDGSRVVVLRPNFSESWAFFVRKFDLPNASLEQLIKHDHRELPVQLITYLMKGARITAVTGAQGSGKTTLLMAMVRHIYAMFTLRVQEMAFELHLRRIYPFRNILSLRETPNISGQEGLDVQKKTDGTVNILGEVATDPVAAWMIQMGQVASLFTLFTHHAKTARDLVYALRNSLLKTGMFSDEKIAEYQVVSVVDFDIHLRKDHNGERYIERITEIVPLEENLPYPDAYRNASSVEEMVSSGLDTVSEYFRRSTDRQSFVCNNIIEFRNGRYEAVHRISNRNVAEMLENMAEADSQGFLAFMEQHWGDAG